MSPRTFNTVLQILLAIAITILSVRTSMSREVASDGRFVLVIPNDIEITSPDCDRSVRFSLSGALYQHFDYYLFARRLDGDIVVVSRDSELWRSPVLSLGSEYSRVFRLGSDSDHSAPARTLTLTRFDHEDTGGKLVGHAVMDYDRPLRQEVRRLVDELLSSFPSGRVQRAKSAGAIPTLVYLDSSFIEFNPKNWEEVTRLTLEYSSRAMQTEFDMGLQILPTRVLTGNLAMNRTFEQVFESLLRQLPPRGDTLVVFCYNQPVDDSLGGMASVRHELGRAQTGRRLVLLEGLPYPVDSDQLWLPFDNSQNLIHELGHALGAVHVSDIKSVMNPVATWYGTTRFDELNHQIVTAALEGELSFESKTGYLEYLSRSIEESAYGLCDFPSVLALYLEMGRGRSWRSRHLREAVASQWQINAAEGFLAMRMGRPALAAEKFKLSLEGARHQAAPVYYLSRVVDPDLGERIRRKAAAMGYYRAAECANSE